MIRDGAGTQFDPELVKVFLSIERRFADVSDRIRENLLTSGREDLRSVINRSINETLSRTILTSTTTLLVLTSLFLFGGAVIHGFAFALIVGVVFGTYSSIFIASPIVAMWKGGASVSASKAKA